VATVESESCNGPAEYRTLYMRRHSMLENREISAVFSSQTSGLDRAEKACGRNPGTNAVQKSDINIVPKNVPNKSWVSNSGGTGGKDDHQRKF